MFRSFLRHVRSQSKAVRDQYAFAFAASFTAVVAILWVTTNYYSTGGKFVAEAGDESERSMPFQSLFNQVGEQWASLKGGLSASGVTADPESGVPAVAEATSTQAFDMVLSTETVSALGTSTTRTAADMPAPTATTSTYIEVQIATTSASTNRATTTVAP
jgi:hypothetical protein